MLDEIALVESDDELSYQPKPIEKKIQQPQIKTIQDKREQFRFQIRKEQIEEQLEKKRMWFQPKQRFQNKESLPCINVLFNTFKQSYDQGIQQQISQDLHSLANIIDDRNRIHSLYLTQRNFLQFKKLLLEESYLMDSYIIFSQLTQDVEYFSLNAEDILWTVERSLEVLEENPQDDLHNLILGYLSNVASKMLKIQEYLLQKNALKLVLKYIKPTLMHNICYLTQTICNKIPNQFLQQLSIGLQICAQMPQDSPECLQTLFIIIRQSDYYNEVDYEKILQVLFRHVQNYLKNELDFESFYSALVQLKHLSDFINTRIVNLFLQFRIVEFIQKLISYKYQKIRTAGLHILQNLCKSGHNIIILIFKQEELIKKLINILTTDKPVNQSLVLKSIIHIFKYGKEQDFVNLLDLGITAYLASILKSSEPYILLQGIDCTTQIMNFGLQFQQQLNIPNPILNKLHHNQVIEIIEKLQYHQNEEVFNQAQRFINQYFKTDIIQ